MYSSRSIRLQNDYLAMEQIRSETIQWEPGDVRQPPEKYFVQYNLRGMSSPDFYCDKHLVEIKLLAEYPMRPPVARFVSHPQLFHPHVFDTGLICIGGYSPDESLAALCLRIARYIQYQPHLIDTRSPANLSALEWFKRNREYLPVDATPLPELPD